jgi:hypothetical protein
VRLTDDRAQIPFDGFVMTKAGTINTQPVSMLRERVRSVGVSLLGGNSGVEGPYELGIDEIRAVNDEDVTVPPRTFFIYQSLLCFCQCSYSGQFRVVTLRTRSAMGTRANMINAPGQSTSGCLHCYLGLSSAFECNRQ